MARHNRGSQYLTQEQTPAQKLDRLYNEGSLFNCMDIVRKAKSPQSLWGNWIVENTLVLQSGTGGIAKTTFNFSLITHLQDEGVFLGVKGKQDIKVLYFDFESGESLIKTRMSLIGKLDIDHPYFYFCNMQGVTFKDVVPYIEKFICDVWLPDIIFIDPLSLALRLIDENDNMEATKAMEFLRTFMRKWHTTLVLVHHSGKADTKGVGNARGASAQGNLADIVWEYHNIPKHEELFELNIPKNRFINDGFRQCIERGEGEFYLAEFPRDYEEAGKSVGVKTYQMQLKIRELMKDYTEREFGEIMKELGIMARGSEFQLAQRAITALIQKGELKKLARGLYVYSNGNKPS